MHERKALIPTALLRINERSVAHFPRLFSKIGEKVKEIERENVLAEHIHCQNITNLKRCTFISLPRLPFITSQKDLAREQVSSMP